MSIPTASPLLAAIIAATITVFAGCGQPRKSPHGGITAPALPPPEASAAYVAAIASAAPAADTISLGARVNDLPALFSAAAMEAADSGDFSAAERILREWNAARSHALELGLTDRDINTTSSAIIRALLDARLESLQAETLRQLPRSLEGSNDLASAEIAAARIATDLETLLREGQSAETENLLAQTVQPLRNLFTTHLEARALQARRRAEQGGSFSNIIREIEGIPAAAPSLVALFPVEYDQAHTEILELDRGLRRFVEGVNRTEELITPLRAETLSAAEMESILLRINSIREETWPGIGSAERRALSYGVEDRLRDLLLDRIAGLRKEAILQYGSGASGSNAVAQLGTLARLAPGSILLVTNEFRDALSEIAATSAVASNDVVRWGLPDGKAGNSAGVAR